MKKASPTIRKALKVVLKADRSQLTDQELLRSFSDEEDQDAFATLVRRHTSLVLGVCRRVLPTAQDAEDACQATFLVLARKAPKNRWQASIANWLYTTARRIAKDARLSVQQRAKWETKAQITQPVEPIDQITGRELLMVLDEELDKLPLIYREPLILCYLEGLSREEVATRLVVPEGTIKIRLERGRKKLNDALTKRNVLTGMGLLALAATSSLRASSTNLFEKIQATIFSTPSKTVADLAKGVAMNGVFNKSIALGIAALIFIGLGVGLGTLPPMSAGADDKKSMPAKKSTNPETKTPEESQSTKEFTISGKVVGPDGKPVAGAELIALWLNNQKPESMGKSAEDGTFQVTVPLKDPETYLIASAQGHGVDFLPVSHSAKGIELKLPKDLVIRGSILDTEGKPVVGAEVNVRNLQAYQKGSVTPFLNEWKTRHFMSGLPGSDKGMWLYDSKNRTLADGSRILAAKTNQEGVFELKGVGEERVAILSIRGPGIAEAEGIVVNRKAFDAKPYNQASLDNVPKGFERMGVRWFLHTPTPTFVVEQEKIIRGVVTDRETGKPRVGAKVRFERTSGNELLTCPVSAITDREGKYEIRGAKKSHTYILDVSSDEKEGYLACQVSKKDTDGYAPVTIDIGVTKGVVIQGKMIDQVTRKPVPGQISVALVFDNAFAEKMPTFASPLSFFHRVATDPQGNFRIVTIPGRVILMGGTNSLEENMKYKPAKADPKYPQYFLNEFGTLVFFTLNNGRSPIQGTWCKVLESKETDREIEQDIELEPALQKEVKVQDPEGKSVSEVFATGIASLNWMPPRKFPSGIVQAYNLEPKQPRLLVFYEPKQKLVGTLTVKADDKEPIVKLGSGGTVQGRLVDPMGKPVEGVIVRFHYENREAEEIHDQIYRGKQITTDRDGRYQMEGIIPGQTFRLTFRQGKRELGPKYQAAARQVIEKHGAKLELPEMKVDPLENRGDE